MSAILKVENLNVTLSRHRRVSKSRWKMSALRSIPVNASAFSASPKWQEIQTVKSVLGPLDKNFQVSGSAIFDGQDLLKETKEELAPPRKPDHHGPAKSPLTCFGPALPHWKPNGWKPFYPHLLERPGDSQPVSGNSRSDADPERRRGSGKIPAPAFRRHAPAHHDRHCHGPCSRSF